MSETSIEFYINRGEGDDEEEIELEIRGWAEPYVPAKLSGHPDTWEPPEGGGSGVEGIFLNGEPWKGKLTKKEEQEAESALAEKFLEDMRDAAEYAAECKAEAMMDDYYDDYDDGRYGAYGPDIYDF
jgi:hypothetical protein